MYWLDGVLLVGICIGALLGACSGFVQQISRIVGLAVAFYTAFLVNDFGTRLLLDYLLRDAEDYVARCLAFLLVFFAIYLVIYYGTRLLQRLIHAVNLDSTDRLLGALVGATKMTLVMSLLCLGLTNFPHPKSQEVISQSVVAPALVTGLDLVVRAIPAYYKEQVHNGIAALEETLHPESAKKQDQKK